MSVRTAHDELISRLLTLKKFDHVAQAEPSSPPGKGLYAAVWFDRIQPVERLSTLTHIAMLYVYIVRFYKPATSEPRDSIDLDLVDATDAFLTSVFGTHKLGSTLYEIDALGRYSDGVQVNTDYVQFGGRSAPLYRVVDITLPVYGLEAYTYG